MKNRRLWALVALTTLTLAACAETKADQVGLKYGDGPIEGEHYEKMIDSGSGQVFVWNDKVINFPTNQREVTFCEDVRPEPDKPGCDFPQIKVTALRGAELAFSGGVTFEIATGSEDTLRAFNEELCRKFDCADEDGLKDDGWHELLRVNFQNPIEDSLQEIVRRFSVDAIYAGVPAEGEDLEGEEAVSTLTQISDQLAASLKETITDYVGGEFFCGPGYDRTKPDECPDFEFVITEVVPTEDSVKQAFDRNVASRQSVVDAENEGQALVVEAEKKREAQEALAGLYENPSYLAYLQVLAIQKCAENPNCTLIVGDAGNVTIAPRNTTQGG